MSFRESSEGLCERLEREILYILQSPLCMLYKISPRSSFEMTRAL
ncbi:MAG: hypothetical protein JWR38_1544 [Mucilaginibacter sp.]|nr:hypothetical protein [Mucilaginibacter sp.]